MDPTRRPESHIEKSNTRDRAPVKFYPSPEDLKVMDQELPKEPFLAVSLTASVMQIGDRTIPGEIALSAFLSAAHLGIPIVLLGRTYPGSTKNRLAILNLPRFTDLTDRLSVPGTAEVLKRSTVVFTSHSCLLQLAWYERKPVFTTYPSGHYEHGDFGVGSEFGFGRNYPETVHMTFEQYTSKKFHDFLKKSFP